MPSVIPPVMLSVSVLVMLVLILGSVMYYYTAIVSEPPILPSYGSVYVRDVSRSNGTVVVVNRFGYPVKALLSIAINSDAVRMDLNITPPAILATWLDLNPGETSFNIYDIVLYQLGAVKPEYVLWDESGFTIANVFFPLERGVGAPLPTGGSGTRRENTYTLTGIGTSRYIPRYVFSTKYFDGTTMSTTLSHYLAFGYMRSICGYREPTVITTYRYGWQCVTSYSQLCGCSYWDCARWVNNTCAEWVCYSDCIDYRTDYDVSPYHDYNSYPCGLDQGVCFYRTPYLTSIVSQTVRSPALLGLMNEYTGLVNDTKRYILGQTTASTSWEYILPSNQQEQCVYTYREIEYWTTYSTGRVCCSTCSDNTICATAYYCTQHSAVRYTEQRHACQYALGGNWWCAGLATFLVGELTSGVATVWVRQSQDSVVITMNLTASYRYTRYYDPEYSDNVVRFVPIYLLEVVLPHIRGYISIPYSEELVGVRASVSATVLSSRAVVSTGSGYRNSFPSILATAIGWEGDVTTAPVGYVTVAREGIESSKTFYFSTVSQPTVYIKVYQEQEPYVTVPACNLPCNSFGCSCSDTVRVSVEVTVRLTPGTTIRTVG